MKRVRVCLNAGCYDMPQTVPVKEMPILFDNDDSYRGSYDDDYLNKLQIVGSLWYLDLYRVPSPVLMENEIGVCSLDDAMVIQDTDMQEIPHEDTCGPTLRGVRRHGGISYEMEWKHRYEGLVANEFCDGKLLCFFCWRYDFETREMTNCRCVLKKGNYKRNLSAHNVKVIEE